MPTEIQAALSLPWRDATPVQAALSAAWRDATPVQSIGSAYTRPEVPGGTPVPPGGSLAPRFEVLPGPYYPVPCTVEVRDLRDGELLPCSRVQLGRSDGSTHHTATLSGTAALAAKLRAGEQPAQVSVQINTDVWHLLVEEIDQPRAFARGDVTVRARSLAALADAPTQADQQWQVDAPTTAAQLAALAQTFTGLEVTWDLGDWLLPAGSWSYTGTPLGLVRALAAAVGADVVADRTGYGVTVRARYDQAPNLWATTPPDWQVPLAAVQSVQQQRADTPEYDGIVVAGPRQGDVLQARLAGTSGARQAPMVTDPALTDIDALRLRADATLLSYGKQLQDTRALQIHSGRAIRDGELVRWVDDDRTWTGRVRSYSIDATLASAVQTVTCERRTAWITGTVKPPPSNAVPVWVAYSRLTEDTAALVVPPHAAGDLLLLFLRGLGPSSATPALPAGWESVGTGGNGSNSPRWRLCQRVDTAGTIATVPTQPDDARPYWVAIFRGARVQAVRIDPPEVEDFAAWAPLGVSDTGSRVVAGVHAGTVNVIDYDGPMTFIGGDGSPFSNSWGLWLGLPAGTAWPGDRLDWRNSAGTLQRVFYETWAIELVSPP